ncbi:hypothetical protein SLEP1_g36426 [Rubroshorea leprosula]|uniref:Uncharacterized protein n=1 Tax=Rubroshorea leprosula TaxID=152421 RepID=A0AAV5KRY9_9ROSI|nr:hypothetical protein SLEP1_g36426 [Rubroshorea leprosula]
MIRKAICALRFSSQEIIKRAVLGALAFCTLRPTLPLSLGHVSFFKAFRRNLSKSK